MPCARELNNEVDDFAEKAPSKDISRAPIIRSIDASNRQGSYVTRLSGVSPICSHHKSTKDECN